MVTGIILQSIAWYSFAFSEAYFLVRYALNLFRPCVPLGANIDLFPKHNAHAFTFLSVLVVMGGGI